MRKTIALALLLLPVLVTSQERVKQYPVAVADGIVGPGGGPRSEEYVAPSVGICQDPIAWWSMEDADNVTTLADSGPSRSYNIPILSPPRLVRTSTDYGVVDKGLSTDGNTMTATLSPLPFDATGHDWTITGWTRHNSPCDSLSQPPFVVRGTPVGGAIFSTRLHMAADTFQEFTLTDVDSDDFNFQIPDNISCGTAGVRVFHFMTWNQATKTFRAQRRTVDVATGVAEAAWVEISQAVPDGLNTSGGQTTQLFFFQPNFRAFYDEVAVWDKVVSDADRDVLWADGLGLTCPGATSPPPPPTCPCYSTASIQAVLDTCLTIQTNSCSGAQVTLTAFCSGPPVTNMGSWIQLAAGNECSRLFQDPETGNPASESFPVTAEERAACTAILTPFCPPE